MNRYEANNGWIDGERCGKEPPPRPGDGQGGAGSTPGTSITPEDKFGPSGYDAPDTEPGGEERFVVPDQVMDYRVEFWNKPDALVPTQDAIIIDRLDPAVFDLSTLEITRVGFLNWDVAIASGQVVDTRIDCRPEMNIAVEIRAGLGMEVPGFANNADIDENTLVFWFHCIDPMTGQWPDDPMAGFLPPYNPETGFEIGWIEYTVNPVQDLPTGTELANVAFVEFDFAGDIYDHPAPKVDPEVEPAEPAPWINTIDAAAPTSSVVLLPAVVGTAEFLVTWDGQDDAGGSGIAHYNVYVSTDGGVFERWLQGTTETETLFVGEEGRSYAFYCIATDNVGHREMKSATPETTTVVDAAPVVTGVFLRGTSWSSAFSFADGCSLSDVGQTVSWTNIDKISIVFSEDMNVTESDLALWGVNVADYVSEVGFVPGSFSYDSVTFTATWTLATPIGADKLLIDLNGDAGGVTDASGNLLDGDWPGAVPGFPSGDGTAGGDFRFRFNVLPGDVNGTGMVTADDFYVVRNLLGTAIGDAAYSPAYDMNGDGLIISNDVVLLRNRLGTALPEGEPVVPGESMMPRLPGDANGDGVVDGEDAKILASNWGRSGMNWANGDFNKDGTVNAIDAAILAANFGATFPADQSAPAEPLRLDPPLIGPMPATEGAARITLVDPRKGPVGEAATIAEAAGPIEGNAPLLVMGAIGPEQAEAFDLADSTALSVAVADASEGPATGPVDRAMADAAFHLGVAGRTDPMPGLYRRQLLQRREIVDHVLGEMRPARREVADEALAAVALEFKMPNGDDGAASDTVLEGVWAEWAEPWSGENDAQTFIGPRKARNQEDSERALLVEI
ncbi:MAG: hypothetical protein GX621_07660 [Pirellulaceae bacterium]|nr:hypothetical protein [Pirellulaceae bacterium]